MLVVSNFNELILLKDVNSHLFKFPDSTQTLGANIYVLILHFWGDVHKLKGEVAGTCGFFFFLNTFF